MDKFIVNGPTRLEGTIEISGAKNAVLPLMAAALLARGESVIENAPRLRDVNTMVELLELLGARVTHHTSPHAGPRCMVDLTPILLHTVKSE